MSEEKKITQMIANVLMFVPLGFIFPAVFDSARKCRKTVICMALFSFAIEIAQYFIGRSADIDDLMLNTVGGGLGYGVFFLVDKLWGKRKFWRKFCARQ